MAREMGSELRSPYMLISFMALLVIPSLKISDLGLFDAEQFRLLNVQA
jgi:adenine deaminase